MSADAERATHPPGGSPELDKLKSLGKYAIQRKLGAGGMGTVFLAVDEDLRRTVALKVLPRERAENPVLVKRFKAEGQAAAHLQHENIVSVYEAGEIEGYLYLALEFVDGVDALEWMRKRGIFPVKRSIDIIRHVARALEHAHEKRIVHRDIKPSNLMIKMDGTVKLADMGLARSVDETLDTSITRAGTTVGTVDYMAPEQARDSKAADARSDLYSLGCTWYHMLTGSPPYPGGSVTNKLQAHATAPLPDPREANPNIPEGVVAVIHRMLAKRPQDRYQSATELLKDLNNANVARTGITSELLDMLTEDGFSDGEVASRAEFDDPEEFDAPETPSKPRAQRATEAGAGDTTAPRRAGRRAGESESASRTGGQARRRSGARGRSGDESASAGGKTGRAASRKGQQRPQGAKRSGPNERVRGPRSTKTTPVGAPDGNKPEGRGVDIDSGRVVLVAVLIVAVGAGGWWGLKYLQRPAGSTPAIPEGVNPYAPTGPETQGAAADAKPDEGGPQGDTANAETTGPTSEETDPSVAQATTQDLTPFPGTDDLDPEDPSAKSQVPAWVWKVRERRPDKRTITVVRHPRGADQVSHIATAFERLGTSGGVIELAHPGPHPITPIVHESKAPVVIRGVDGTAPLLVADGAMLGDDGIWFRSTQGAVELDGVQCVLVRRDLCVAETVRLFAIESGEVSVHDSAFVVLGETTRPVSLFSLGNSSGSAARLLIEDSVIRGVDASAIEVRGRGAEIVLGNCLLVTPEAAVIRMRTADASTTRSPLSVHVMGSTLIGNTGIEIENGKNQSSWQPIDMHFRRSLLVGHAADDSDATAILLRNFPDNAAGRLEEARVQDVAVELERTRFVGWEQLTELTPSAEPARATDPRTWRQFWRRPLASGDAIAEPVAGIAEAAGAVNWEAARLNPLVSKYQAPEAGSEAGVGHDVDTLPTGSRSLLARVHRIASRVIPPAWFDDETPPAKTIVVDLKRDRNLQGIIDSRECPSGSVIVCTGIGLKYLQPFTVKEKQLQIVFQQEEGAPLEVQPAGYDDASAWITVESGRLELVNARFELSSSHRSRMQAPLFRMVEGDLLLQRCTVHGATKGEPAPLIDMATGSQAERRRWLAVDRTMLHHAGTLISGSLASDSIWIDQSVLATQQSCLEVSGSSGTNEVTLNESTFVVGNAVLDQASTETPAEGTLDVFARSSVFVPWPLVNADRASIVFSRQPTGLSESIRWWESSCAFSSGFKTLLRAGEMGTPRAGVSQWNDQWGPDHVLDMLTGAQGVLFSGVLPEFSDLEASLFRLANGCRAATWGAGEQPIGAPVGEVGPDLSLRVTGQDAPKETKPTPSKPTRRRPDF